VVQWRIRVRVVVHAGEDSPADAAAAGCPDTKTPFNGDHTAGIQVLSTRNFDKLQGPLRQLIP
jgi:hypothetical protein